MKSNILFAKRNLLILEHNYKEIKKIARMSSNDPNFDHEATERAQSFLLGYDMPNGYDKEDNIFTYHGWDNKERKYVIRVTGYIPSTFLISLVYSVYYNIKHNTEEDPEKSDIRILIREWLMNPMTIIKMI